MRLFAPALALALPDVSSNLFAEDTGNWEGEAPHVTGFCAEAPCLDDNCCCWSTFGAVSHDDYPNPREAINDRKCAPSPNPELAMVKDPGGTSNLGKAAILRNTPNEAYFGDRDLCCAIPATDQLTQASADEQGIRVPVLDPRPPPAPLARLRARERKPKAKAGPWDLGDVTAADLERHAAASAKAASSIFDAVDALKDTAAELNTATDSVKQMNAKQITKMRAAVQAHNIEAEELLKGVHSDSAPFDSVWHP
mmetsp:Transcript_21468/g.52161  ORF Transcript_21468/g.52161 Transcript_21468/m.52161 type:complete len:253 (+) Transcript_21468:53-811(+)